MFRLAKRNILAIASLCLVLLGASSAGAQPADDCAGAQLTGASTLPFNGNFTPSNLAINLTGGGCANPAGFAPESVVCFIPTSSCSVNYTCSYSGGTPNTGASAVNVRDMGVGGACVATPGSCVAGLTASASPVSLLNVSLTAGRNYCFICSSPGQVPGDTQVHNIAIASGNCGALPVQLLGVGVETSR